MDFSMIDYGTQQRKLAIRAYLDRDRHPHPTYPWLAGIALCLAVLVALLT